MTPIEEFVTANGLRHHVLHWGERVGPTIVLCHGFLDVAWSFDAVAQLLARTHHVVAFDWRGHGESEWVGALGSYPFADYLLDLDRLLPTIASGPVHLVGHSMGGMVCVAYAGVRPSRVATLTSIEGVGVPARSAEAIRERIVGFLDSAPVARERFSRPMASLDDAARRLRANHPALSKDLAQFLAEKATRRQADGYVFAFDPVHRAPAPNPFRPDVFLHLAASVTAPTLLVFGEHGMRLPDERQRVATFARREVAEVPGVDHMVHWHAPDALAEAIYRHVTTAS